MTGFEPGTLMANLISMLLLLLPLLPLASRRGYRSS